MCADCHEKECAFVCRRCRSGLCAACADRRIEENGFRVGIDPGLVEFDSAQLPAPQMRFSDLAERDVAVAPERGSWDVQTRRMHFRESATLDRFVVFFSEQVRQDEVFKFLDTLQCIAQGGGMFRGMGVRINKTCKLVAVSSRDFAGGVRAEMQALAGQGPTFAIALLDTGDAEVYDSVKAVFGEHNLLSQCVTMKRVREGKAAVLTKVLMQIFTKLGVAPWSCDMPLPPHTMVVGIDAVRGPRGSRAVALVASTDPRCEHYSSQAQLCESGTVDCLTPLLATAMAKYRARSGHDPENILIYRNGVSDAEIALIEENRGSVPSELSQVRSAFENMPYPPSILYVLVVRKASTRIFSFNGNPAPGTVADDVITVNPVDPRLGHQRRDFYLIAQSVREGCVKPTHCRVLCNTVGMDIKVLEHITYALAHMYFNWTGTVPAPAPVILAQKLTKHIVEHGQLPPNGTLIDNTYYI